MSRKKQNTRAKMCAAIKKYRLPDGSRAVFMEQLPQYLKDYLADRITEICRDEWIYSDDIPDIIADFFEQKIIDVIDGIFYPFQDHYDYIAAEKREQKRASRQAKEQQT